MADRGVEGSRSPAQMRLPHRVKARTGGVAALVALACAAPAVAAPPPPMVVEMHPASGGTGSYFDLSARPGRRAIAGTLELRNRLDRKVRVALDRVDGLTASTLGSAYRLRGSKIHGPTRWIRLSKGRVTLPPRGKATVSVSVSPRKRARAGDYLSGIGVQALGRRAQTKTRGNLAIASIQRYAVGVLVRIPGPRQPLIRFTDARVQREPAGVAFFASAANIGNVILQGVRGRVTITQGDRIVARKPIGPGTFVTGTSIHYPVLVAGERPAEGTVYRLRAFMRYRSKIARLDTRVRFGSASAQRQAEFGKAVRDSGSGFLTLLLALVAATAVLAMATFLLLWLRAR
jgi:hypothetical protein